MTNEEKMIEEEIVNKKLYNDMPYSQWQFPTYVNSHIVGTIGGTSITVCDVVNAQQAMGNNVSIRGKKGGGKTQLLTDIARNRYHGQGILFEGSKDFDKNELLKRVRLDKLREARSSEEIIELAQRVSYHFIGVDEITRFPEIVQPDVLSIMNGYVMHNGEQVYFGDGHCSGISTGNVGNGYVATFALDDALADRFHLILNLDYWKPTIEDMAELDMRTDINPRVIQAELRDLSDKVIAVQKILRQQETMLEFTIIGRYLERALDYCQKYPDAKNSKDNLGSSWPVICTQDKCELKDTICGRVKSIGERANRATKSLAKGLIYMARLKDARLRSQEYEGTKMAGIDAGILAAKLVLPYAEVISKQYMQTTGIHGNANIAMNNIATEIETDITEKIFTTGPRGEKVPGEIMKAVSFASKGQLEQSPPYTTEGKWEFMKQLLEKVDKQAKDKKAREQAEKEREEQERRNNPPIRSEE